MTQYMPPPPPEMDYGTPVAPIIPHSREAEEAVIGAVFIGEAERYYEIANLLSSDDFYIHKLRWIWEAFISLHGKRSPIDLLTVADELERDGRLSEVGGPAFLTSLINAAPTSLNAVSYAGIMKEHSTRRKMIAAANKIATAAYDTSESVSACITEAEKAWGTVREQTTKPTMMNAREIMSQAYDRYSAIVEYGRPPGITTNLLDLDRILHGLKKGWFYLFAGRPGDGKSALMLTLMKNICKFEQQSCAYFSIEMQESTPDGDMISGGELSSRLLAMEAGLDASAIIDGRLTEDEYGRFVGAIEKAAKWNFSVDDDSRITPDQMFARCLQIKSERGLDVVFVDYIQLQNSGGKFGTRAEEVSYLSRNLKQMGKELNVAMVAAAQVNRAFAARGDKRLFLTDLKESGSLEQDPNAVIFIQPTDTKNVKEVDVAKHRGGQVGPCNLYFDAPSTEFRNSTRRDEEAVYWWHKNGKGNH